MNFIQTIIDKIKLLLLYWRLRGMSHSALEEQLVWAIRNSNSRLLKVIVPKKLDPNLRFTTDYQKGLTPLMYCCIAKNQSAIEYLLSCGADLELVDSNKRNTLLYCLLFSCQKNNDLALYLIKNGANYNCIDVHSYNAAFYIMRSVNPLELLQTLHNHGYQINDNYPSFIDFAFNTHSKAVKKSDEQQLLHSQQIIDYVLENLEFVSVEKLLELQKKINIRRLHASRQTKECLAACYEKRLLESSVNKLDILDVAGQHSDKVNKI